MPNFMNGNLAGSPLKIHIYVEFNLEYVSFVSPNPLTSIKKYRFFNNIGNEANSTLYMRFGTDGASCNLHILLFYK